MAFLPGISTAVATVKSVVDYLIGAAVATAILLVAYEGVPMVRDIPLIGWIPVVGDLATGRVQREADKAVKAATAELVARSEVTALRSQIAEIERQRQVADAAATAARARADKALKETADALAKLDAAIADDDDPDAPVVGVGDLDWVSKH